MVYRAEIQHHFRVSNLTTSELRKKTILFIEDEQELLTTVSNLLYDHGYEVIGVKKAEDALDELKKSIPDLLLVDIKLPGKDGFDFLEEVRRIKECNGVPFVFLTAFNDLKAMAYAKKQGAAEYITKPFEFEYLVTRIRDLAPPN